VTILPNTPFQTLIPSVEHPFTAIVAHRAAKHALLLLAIEPRLGGVLISCAGCCDGRLTRAFGNLISSEIEADSLHGSQLVEVPVNVGEDRLIGGLDLQRTLSTGIRAMSPGLLARANGRLLFSNNINLLEPRTASHIAGALDTGCVQLEREGVSSTYNSKFIIVGTYNPAEGEPSARLRERVGLIVEEISEHSADASITGVDRAFQFEQDPSRFVNEFADEISELRSRIVEARRRLSNVRVNNNQIRKIAESSLRLGVVGNHADDLALKAARANAALQGRNRLADEDLIVAIRFVLVPRATRNPQAEIEEAREESETKDHSDEADTQSDDSFAETGGIEDLLVAAVDATPPNLLPSTARFLSPATRAGKRIETSKAKRGRYTLSASSRKYDSRVAIDATIRAAAPFQHLRRKRFAIASQDATKTPAIRVAPDDLRFKRFKHRSGMLFIFVVDASGSMALNRMSQAKGALTRLLQQAYLHRDNVALIAFRGTGSEVLLAPARSVELARRIVDSLPAGGGTPLGDGMVKAIELARQARLRGMSRAMLVLFTDGRANVSLSDSQSRRTQSSKSQSTRSRSAIADELKAIGGLLRSEDIGSLVVDTKSRFVSTGEAAGLAETLGASYYYLPRSDAREISEAIAETAAHRRMIDD
jgi:magnesium chelatase subunit D